jgi:hypothetical protein
VDFERVVLALLAVRRTRATILRAVRRTAFTRRTARAFGRDEVVLFDRERDDVVALLRARDARFFGAAAIRLPPKNDARIIGAGRI